MIIAQPGIIITIRSLFAIRVIQISAALGYVTLSITRITIILEGLLPSVFMPLTSTMNPKIGQGIAATIAQVLGTLCSTAVRTNDCALIGKINFPAVVQSVVGAAFTAAESKIVIVIAEPMITDLKNRYVFDYHHVYSSGQFVFFTAGGSWGGSWGEVNSITTQGTFAALDNRSTRYPSWSDVGSLYCSSSGMDN